MRIVPPHISFPTFWQAKETDPEEQLRELIWYGECPGFQAPPDMLSLSLGLE